MLQTKLDEQKTDNEHLKQKIYTEIQTIVAFLGILKPHCNMMCYHINSGIPGLKSCSQVNCIHKYK
jgi:hypothetical protein